MKFRQWCHEKWQEHQEELSGYGQPLPYTSREYFNKYRWWLKREYQSEQQRVQKTLQVRQLLIDVL